MDLDGGNMLKSRAKKCLAWLQIWALLMATVVRANKNAKYKPIATNEANFIEDSSHKNYG